jgi:hypothetical protein
VKGDPLPPALAVLGCVQLLLIFCVDWRAGARRVVAVGRRVKHCAHRVDHAIIQWAHRCCPVCCPEQSTGDPAFDALVREHRELRDVS